MSDTSMSQEKYLLDKAFEVIQESVKANQASASANLKNADATQRLQELVNDQVLLGNNLTDAVHGLNDTMKDVVKGLQAVAESQKLTAEVTQKEKEKYFKYLVYAVIFIIVILGGGAALKIFFGFDLAAIL